MTYPITINIEETNTGLSAYVNEYSIATTGKDLPELLKNLQEAISLFDNEN